MKYRDRSLVQSILAECRDVVRYTAGVDEKRFLVDDILQKASAMSLLNIGERSNSLTREFWVDHPEIPWRRIVNLRNLVAHGYGDVRMDLIWNLAIKEIPDLIMQLERLLDEPPEAAIQG